MIGNTSSCLEHLLEEHIFFRWLVYWYFDIEQANVCQWRFDSLVVFFVKKKKENEQFFFRFWYFSKLNRAIGYFWGLNNSMNFISISIKLQNVLIKIENLIFTVIRWKMLSILTNITINYLSLSVNQWSTQTLLKLCSTYKN